MGAMRSHLESRTRHREDGLLQNYRQMLPLGLGDCRTDDDDDDDDDGHLVWLRSRRCHDCCCRDGLEGLGCDDGLGLRQLEEMKQLIP